MSNGLIQSNSIKILFPIHMGTGWLGGVNYYKNLFQAISMVNDSNVEIYIPDNNPDELNEYANIISYKKDLKYRITKILNLISLKKFDKNAYFTNRFMNFDIISHSNPIDKQKVISWIPDFQHIYLKDLFSEEEIIQRNSIFKKCAEEASLVILSSKDAQDDFNRLYPEYVNKSRVLNFVSYVNPNIYDISENVAKIIKEKYNLPIKYFYLPNQFWQHKNHIIVFKAINYLKQKGINIQLICSGYMQDYRNKDYLDNVLLKYIKENHLENNIHFLGVIPLDDVFYLMRNCVSIINPSLFEGWSSTVEEAKSMGKNMILSDLNVHKEQNPPESKFFKREDFIDLANIMQSDWENLNSEPNYALENSARTNLNKRMIEFGKNYLNIVKELI